MEKFGTKGYKVPRNPYNTRTYENTYVFKSVQTAIAREDIIAGINLIMNKDELRQVECIMPYMNSTTWHIYIERKNVFDKFLGSEIQVNHEKVILENAIEDDTFQIAVHWLPLRSDNHFLRGYLGKFGEIVSIEDGEMIRYNKHKELEKLKLKLKTGIRYVTVKVKDKSEDFKSGKCELNGHTVFMIRKGDKIG
jgi:hypothetical protein